MARRRYLSTNISTDRRVNRLAVEHGDFAALLYTWMIPHAADDGSIVGDPEELQMIVVPGRRDKTVADVENALSAMAGLELIEWRPGARWVQFPQESFYKNQSYIKGDRRSPPPADISRSSANVREIREVPEPVPQISANQRTSAQNGAVLEIAPTSAQIPASFSLSSSFSSLSPNGENGADPFADITAPLKLPEYETTHPTPTNGAHEPSTGPHGLATAIPDLLENTAPSVPKGRTPKQEASDELYRKRTALFEAYVRGVGAKTESTWAKQMYGRAMKELAPALASGIDPESFEALSRYAMAANEWRPGKAPSVGEVIGAEPGWEAEGRPAVPKPRTSTRPKSQADLNKATGGFVG